MRLLDQSELVHVSGGAGSYYYPCPPKHDKKRKGNNGFGNGGNDPAPGNSGSTGADKAADRVR